MADDSRWRRAVALLRRRLDLPLVAIAVLFALPTLGYVHGRDQASFHYVARQWMDGALPYRDVLDQKPPLIYLVHAVAILISGGAQWGIRLLDIAALVGMAFLIASALPRPAPRGAAGVLAVLLVGFYVTAFDYWMAAQVEMWEALLLLGAWIAVVRIERPDRRAALSGLLVGLALLCKIPALLVGLVITARLGVRAFQERRWRGLARALLLHAAGGAGVLLLVVAYWGWYGGLGDLWEVVIEFNRAYAENWQRPWPESWQWTQEWFSRSLYYKVFPALWLGGLMLAVRARDRGARRDFGWAALLLAAALATVVWQRKFFAYHWGVTLPFTALLATYGIGRALQRWPLATAGVALGILLLGLWRAPGWSVDRHLTYRSYLRSFLQYQLGQRTRREFLAHFNQRGHQYGSIELVGGKLRELAGPHSTLCVEGYEPAFYIVSGLSCSHRFYSTNILTDPRGEGPMRSRWLDEYAGALADRPPSFAVSRDAAALARRGCEVVFGDGVWSVGDCRRGW